MHNQTDRKDSNDVEVNGPNLHRGSADCKGRQELFGWPLRFEEPTRMRLTARLYAVATARLFHRTKVRAPWFPPHLITCIDGESPLCGDFGS